MTQQPAGYPPPDQRRPGNSPDDPFPPPPGTPWRQAPAGRGAGHGGPPEPYQPPPEYELPPRYEQPRYEYGSPSGATDPYGQPPVPRPAGPYRQQPSGPPYGQEPSGPPYGQEPPGPPGEPPYGRAPRSRPHEPTYGHTSHAGPGQPPGAGPPERLTGPQLPPRSVLFIAGAVMLVLLVGGAGAWLIFRDGDRDGAASPTAAVQSFLQAVYGDKDPRRAAALVCSEARDESSLRVKINEISSYQDTELNPIFRWSDPQVVDQDSEVAVVEVTITMITTDERIADQTMHVRVLDKDRHGWWVCNLETVDRPGDPEDSEGGADTESGSGDDG